MKQLSVCALILFVIALCSSDATAGIRRVGLNQTYTTLTAAYTAAVNDDTLLISPGVYNETVTSTKRLHWIGAGYDESAISGRLILNAGSNGTRIEGLLIAASFSGAGGIVTLAATVDMVSIKRCTIEDFDGPGCNSIATIYRVGTPGGSLTIDQCILLNVTNTCGGDAMINLRGDFVTIKNSVLCRRYNNADGDDSAFYGSPQNLTVENCVFLGFTLLINTTGVFPLSFNNNIVHDWTSSASWGTYPGGGTGWSYNASSTIAPPGTNGILLTGDPFVNYDETANFIYGSSDLHVTGSPCIDAGDPAILDLDNSRSDMGVYGGPTPHVDGGAPNYPFTIAFGVPSSMTAGQQLPIQATGRIGAGY